MWHPSRCWTDHTEMTVQKSQEVTSHRGLRLLSISHPISDLIFLCQGKERRDERQMGCSRALLSMPHSPVAPALMAWWEGQGWGHTSPMWDGSMPGTWRIHLGELCGMKHPPEPCRTILWPRALSPKGHRRSTWDLIQPVPEERAGMLLAQSHGEQGSFTENYNSTGPGTWDFQFLPKVLFVFL